MDLARASYKNRRKTPCEASACDFDVTSRFSPSLPRSVGRFSRMTLTGVIIFSLTRNRTGAHAPRVLLHSLLGSCCAVCLTSCQSSTVNKEKAVHARLGDDSVYSLDSQKCVVLPITTSVSNSNCAGLKLSSQSFSLRGTSYHVYCRLGSSYFR